MNPASYMAWQCVLYPSMPYVVYCAHARICRIPECANTTHLCLLHNILHSPVWCAGLAVISMFSSSMQYHLGSVRIHLAVSSISRSREEWSCKGYNCNGWQIPKGSCHSSNRQYSKNSKWSSSIFVPAVTKCWSLCWWTASLGQR